MSQQVIRRNTEYIVVPFIPLYTVHRNEKSFQGLDNPLGSFKPIKATDSIREPLEE